jgi:hypothetical protein
MIRPFAPFTPRPRVVAVVKVARGLPPSDAELTHDTVSSSSYRSLVRLAGTKGTPTLKVLGREPRTLIIGKRA